MNAYIVMYDSKPIRVFLDETIANNFCNNWNKDKTEVFADVVRISVSQTIWD